MESRGSLVFSPFFSFPSACPPPPLNLVIGGGGGSSDFAVFRADFVIFAAVSPLHKLILRQIFLVNYLCRPLISGFSAFSFS